VLVALDLISASLLMPALPCQCNFNLNVFRESNLSLGSQQRDRKEGRGNQENDKTAKFLCKKKKNRFPVREEHIVCFDKGLPMGIMFCLCEKF
jgi:hypothetical protein